MSRNVHEVANVLMTNPDLSVLGAGQMLDALSPGQIGIFSHKDNLSIDGTDGVNARQIYLAVGVGDCNGNLVDIKKSSAFAIQRASTSYYTAKCYQPAQGEVWEITDTVPCCDKDYIVKMTFATADSMFNYGWQRAVKSYSVRTSCCDPCGCNCGEADKTDFSVAIAKAINSDEESLVTAVLMPIDDKGTLTVANEIDPTDQAAIDAFKAAATDPAVTYLAVRLYSNIPSIASFCGIPDLYKTPNVVTMNVVGTEGFDCNGQFTRVQDAVIEEYSGADAAWLEYFNAGWEGSYLGPYRQTSSGITLGGKSYGNDCDGCCPGAYHTIQLSTDNKYQEGWRQGSSAVTTTILVPCKVGMVMADAFSFVQVLDRLLNSAGHSAGFEPLFPYVSACSDQCDGAGQPESNVDVTVASSSKGEGSPKASSTGKKDDVSPSAKKAEAPKSK